jgi:hypothetical protein
MKPNPHWLFRARAAHERLATDGGEQQENSTSGERTLAEKHDPMREVQQLLQAYRQGVMERDEYEAAKERVLADSEYRGGADAQ